MIHYKKTTSIVFAALMTIGAFALTPPAHLRASDTQEQQEAKTQARLHWENVVVFYGQEDTGEWSLRILDKDVKAKGWFEFLELWHYNPDEKKWEQLKGDKISKAIVMPKDKTSDEPPDSEMLYELKAITPHTAGLWYAKWRVDDIDCSTPMTVGSQRGTKLKGAIPYGMVKWVVPLTLDKSETMFIPDPKIYCLAGGPGKPDEKDAKK